MQREKALQVSAENKKLGGGQKGNEGIIKACIQSQTCNTEHNNKLCSGVSTRKLYLRIKVAPEGLFQGPIFYERGQQIIIIGKKKSPNANVWSPDTSMKVRYEGPLHVKRTIQSIQDIINDQGFAKQIQGDFKHGQPFGSLVKFSDVISERINTAKQKDGLTSFLMLSVLEVKIFQYDFLEEHKVCVNNHY